MTVTRAVIDAMIASGAPAEQAAGLAECLQISTVVDVDAIVAAFPSMNFIYAMSVKREFRTSFIRWHNANCTPDDAWELEPEDGTWEDLDWVEFEAVHKDNMVAYFYELAASQSAA